MKEKFGFLNWPDRESNSGPSHLPPNILTAGSPRSSIHYASYSQKWVLQINIQISSRIQQWHVCLFFSPFGTIIKLFTKKIYLLHINMLRILTNVMFTRKFKCSFSKFICISRLASLTVTVVVYSCFI